MDAREKTGLLESRLITQDGTDDERGGIRLLEGNEEAVADY